MTVGAIMALWSMAVVGLIRLCYWTDRDKVAIASGVVLLFMVVIPYLVLAVTWGLGL